MADATVDENPVAPEVEVEPERRYGALVTESRGDVVLHPARHEVVDLVRTLRDDEGYWMCLDVCGVDYLGYGAPRALPVGAGPERFEVVYLLINHRDRTRLRIRVQVPEHDAVVPTMFEVHPGTEAPEREVFDMFGIAFAGHPDLTRILMPEDWDGHPLRKDYGIGAIPVQFKGVENHRMSTVQTSEGAQEMVFSRTGMGADELLRELGSVLRMSETEAQTAVPVGGGDDETMIINMGPQHPSTHGVLRLMLELDGETVVRSKPIIGYLHTGMEKTAEDLTFLQGPTNVTRMDYASPLFNELVFSLATEKLLGITDDIPERATWIRMLLCELNRMSSHLLFLATNGLDMGATSVMIYGWREREQVLRIFEKITGLRMNHNFIRPGGVAADLPDGWYDDILALCDAVEPRLEEYDTLMTGQPMWRDRFQGVGVINAQEVYALGATGPILRSTGVAWDLRRDEPYLAYDQVDFDVVVGSYGDAFDRFAIRLNEIRESIRIVRQVIDAMPAGDYRIQDKKVTPPPRARIDESMEALIHHFKIFTEGFKVPAGEAYASVESPRGELGCYIVADGGAKPWRVHVRGPSFINLQTLPHMMHGGLIADAVVSISSVDPIMGEVDR